jgi:3-dehydroquinate synthase
MSIDNASSIRIKSLHRDYEVSFSSDSKQLLTQLAQYEQPLVVIDDHIAEIYSSHLQALLANNRVYTVAASEETKTLTGVNNLINWLMSHQAVRSSQVIAIGGGIIQDLVTFTSCVYHRGIDYVLVPTTLLSMCDSSIGAKCGINHGQFKNQLGVIYAPAAVHICTEFLSTLADLDVMSGCGELLKLALTESETHFRYLWTSLDNDGIRMNNVAELIRHSLLTKRKVIELDEHEANLRRILNYGHTFGHALEALSGYALPHGLGVVWGIDLVNFLAVERGMLDSSIQLEIRTFILKHLKFNLPEFPNAGQLVNATKRDKKVSGGSLNLIMLASYGDLQIVRTEFDERLIQSVSSYLKEENVFA